MDLYLCVRRSLAAGTWLSQYGTFFMDQSNSKPMTDVARDLLAELFDQFDHDEQARIKAAEGASRAIAAEGAAGVRDRLLAAGSSDLSDWTVQPENDARLDAARVVFVAYVNAVWRQTDATRSECVKEFLAKVEQLVESIVARFGMAGEGALDDLVGKCRTNIQLATHGPVTDRADAAAEEFTTLVQRFGILRFPERWRKEQRRNRDLNAVYARRLALNGPAAQRQEELLRDARAYAEAGLGELLSEVRDLFQLKARIVKKTWDGLLPKHRYYADFQLGYREFESALWEEGSPSLEELATAILTEHVASAARTKGNTEILQGPDGELKKAVTLDLAARFGGVSKRAISKAVKKGTLESHGERMNRRVVVSSLLKYFPPEK